MDEEGKERVPSRSIFFYFLSCISSLISCKTSKKKKKKNLRTYV